MVDLRARDQLACLNSMRLMILTISYDPNVGGVETHLTDWVRWLAGRPDIEADVLTYQPITTRAKGLPFEQQGRVRIFRVAWFGRTLFHRLESHPAFQFFYLAPRLLLAGIAQTWRYGPYDVIHAHGLAATWVAGWLKRLFGIPVLASLHAIYSFPPGSKTAARIAAVLASADRVLTLSDASVEQLVAYGVPRQKAERYTYWVDQERFCVLGKRDARSQWGLAERDFIALFVGRLIPIKGVGLVIEMARRLPEVCFVIAGDGPMAAECEVASRGCPNLRFVGRQSNEALPSLFNAADVLLVPSQYEEGYGRVACEALACGTPVIASDRGGLKEVVRQDVGLLVEPSVPAFVAAVDAWWQEPSAIPSRTKCRAWAEERFSARNAEPIERYLVDAIEGRCQRA